MKNPPITTPIDKTITTPIVALPLRHVIKVFSATMARDREVLGDVVTEWLQANHAKIEVDEIRTMQSSDEAFHCVTIIVLAHERPVHRA